MTAILWANKATEAPEKNPNGNTSREKRMTRILVSRLRRRRERGIKQTNAVEPAAVQCVGGGIGRAVSGKRKLIKACFKP
jgi:hypothetical protein